MQSHTALEHWDELTRFQISVLHKALKLELLGMQRSHSPSAYVLLKRKLGLKGNRRNVYNQVERMLQQ